MHPKNISSSAVKLLHATTDAKIETLTYFMMLLSLVSLKHLRETDLNNKVCFSETHLVSGKC